jgi:hypothetical protein
MKRRQLSRLPLGARICLPPDVNLAEMDFQPTEDEKKAAKQRKGRLRLLERLELQRQRFEREELEYLRRRAKTLEAIIEQDRKWLERQAEADALFTEADRKLGKKLGSS